MSNNHTVVQDAPAQEPAIMVRRKPFDRWTRFLGRTWLGKKYYQWKTRTIHHLERLDQSTPYKKKLVFFWSFMIVSIGFFVLVTVIELTKKIEPPPSKTESIQVRKKGSPSIILDEKDLDNIDKLTEGAIKDSL